MKVLGLRPLDLARSAGLTAQTIRRYESAGALPPATRTDGGQRRYGEEHVAALAAFRRLREGFGGQLAVEAMRAVHRGDTAAAFATADRRHADLHAARTRFRQSLEGLRSLGSLDGVPRSRKPLHIGEAARIAGAAPSALRFWEQLGLIEAQRNPVSGYREYDQRQLRRAAVTSLLRHAGHPFETVTQVLEQLEAGDLSAAVDAATRALDDLAVASRRCASATATLVEYVNHRES